EPDLVVPEWTAKGAFVNGRDFVDRLIGRKWGQRTPAVIVERRSKRTAEDVAARLGDHVDDTAAEPAVFRGDGARRDFRLLDRILDEQVERLAAQVLVHDHAVDEVLAFERQRPSHHDVAAWAVTGDARRQQHRVVQRASNRQQFELILLEVAGDRGGQDDVGRLAGDRDVFGDGGDSQRHVQRLRFGHLHTDRLLDGPESLELEGHLIIARRQEWNDVIAIRRRSHRAEAL